MLQKIQRLCQLLLIPAAFLVDGVGIVVGKGALFHLRNYLEVEIGWLGQVLQPLLPLFHVFLLFVSLFLFFELFIQLFFLQLRLVGVVLEDLGRLNQTFFRNLFFASLPVWL